MRNILTAGLLVVAGICAPAAAAPVATYKFQVTSYVCQDGSAHCGGSSRAELNQMRIGLLPVATGAHVTAINEWDGISEEPPLSVTYFSTAGFSFVDFNAIEHQPDLGAGLCAHYWGGYCELDFSVFLSPTLGLLTGSFSSNSGQEEMYMRSDVFGVWHGSIPYSDRGGYTQEDLFPQFSGIWVRDAVAVPEPSSLALLAGGLLCLMGGGRRRG